MRFSFALLHIMIFRSHCAVYTGNTGKPVPLGKQQNWCREPLAPRREAAGPSGPQQEQGKQAQSHILQLPQ